MAVAILGGVGVAAALCYLVHAIVSAALPGASATAAGIATYAVICAVVLAVNLAVLGGRVFEDRATGAHSLDQARRPLFWALVSANVLFIGALAYAVNAWRWGTVPDTSWLITVVERLDAGERLYVDVLELNPPFSVWLYIPPVRLAALLGVAPESVVRLYTMLICLTGTALTGWMLVSSGSLGRRSSAMVSIALFAITVLISGNGFSERDQIGTVLGLPLLILAAWRALPAPKPLPRMPHWLVAGAGGGVLAMVKPYYAVIVVAAACLLAFRRRDIRVLLLPEFVLSGVITGLYLALSYVLYPAFFETLLPLLRDTYMTYRRPLDIMITSTLPWLALPVAYAICRRLIDRHEPSDFLMTAALAAWLPYFLQGKAWAYHSYPAVLFGSAAVVVGLAGFLEKRRTEPRLGLIVISLAAILTAHLRLAATEKPADALVAAGLQEGQTPTVGMLGRAIETGHPLARMINGRWIEPYCNDWLGTYAIIRETALGAAGDTTQADRFQAIATRYFADKKARLLANSPQILIVDRNDALVPEMLGTFGFQSLLDRYDRIVAHGGIELYRLRLNAISLMPAREPLPAAPSN